MAEHDDERGPREAFAILAGFLDLGADWCQRVLALHHDAVPDGVLSGFLHSLDPELRLQALAACNRTQVLASWALLGSDDERAAVAGNCHTDPATLLQLGKDSSESVRREVVLNVSSDIEVLAPLIDDPSVVVQVAWELRRRLSPSELGGTDDEPGDDESLTFLHAMVPAAECLDLHDGYLQLAIVEDCERLVLETLHPDFVELDVPERPAQSVDDVEPWRLTEAQALALLRHHLGAQEFRVTGTERR